LLDPATLDDILSVEAMTQPGIAGAEQARTPVAKATAERKPQ